MPGRRRGKPQKTAHTPPRGNTSHVKLLLSRGANARGKDGKTPLHYAVMKRNADAAELPLKHGADTNAKKIHGKTPATAQRTPRSHPAHSNAALHTLHT
jgi:ankyrin repeat protein